MTLHDAMQQVASIIPISDDKVRQRLDRGYEIARLNGQGYQCDHTQQNIWSVYKASTSMFDDNSITYTVDTLAGTCTCPDYETARGGLCKHRLAIMLLSLVGE